MRQFFRAVRASLFSVAAMESVTAAARADVPLYSSIGGATTSQFTFTNPGGSSYPPNAIYGDDYYTGYSSIVVNSMSFFGGLQAGATSDHLTISFYDLSGNRIASVQPSDAEDHGVALHTLSSADFNQNGVQGITLPGAGYVLFEPITYSIASVNPDGTLTIIPGDPNPVPFTLGFGGLAHIGVNDASLAATVDGNDMLSTGTIVGNDSTLQCAEFELVGTGIGPQSLLGDANDDGRVDQSDLSIVLNNFGARTNQRARGNFDGALTIDLTDLADVLNNFGARAPSSAVASAVDEIGTAAPEPSTLPVGLAVAGFLVLGRGVQRYKTYAVT